MIECGAMRGHLLSPIAAVTATGSLALLAGPALADGSSGAAAPSTTAASGQTSMSLGAATTRAPAASTASAPAASTTNAPAASTANAPAASTTNAPTTGTSSTSATTPTTPTKPPSKPKHKPRPKHHVKSAPAVVATLTLSSPNALRVHKHKAVLPRHSVKVVGSVDHYVPGQFVRVKVSLNKKVFHTGKLSIKPGRHGTGTFTATIEPKRAGILRLQAKHRPNAQMSRFAKTIAISSMSTATHAGARSLFVSYVQQRLARLHFYIPQTGVWDSGTEWAVNAYHRLLDRGTSTALDRKTLNDLVAGNGRFVVRFPKQGRHVEGNLGKQLAALIKGSNVYWIFPISSGKPSTPTILGSFRIYNRVAGYLPDGMYYSDFFIRGYALHGYDPSPDYPASHGCMRLPIQDAIPAFNWLRLGDWVDVYQGRGNYSGTV